MKNLKLLIFAIVVVGLSTHAFTQSILPPYYNNFDDLNDTLGWSHYAISGTDNWELGVPNANKLGNFFSAPNVWATNLDGIFTPNSIMALETPSFDLSDISITYKIGFAHQYQTYSYHGGNVSYSTDGGTTWTVLEGPGIQSKNWYNNSSCNGLGGEPSWSTNFYTSIFKFSYHSLEMLSGEANVKFRFNFGGTNNAQEGWVIENFSIEENLPNVYAYQSVPFYGTNLCPTFDVNTTLIYSGVVTPSFSNKTNYYWSTDSIFDTSDPLIGSNTQNLFNTVSSSETFALPTGLTKGNYYVFFYVDADSNLTELSEVDNLGRALIVIDSIYDIPLISHFDDSTSAWKKGGLNDWQLAPGDIHFYEGTHSGKWAWSIFDTGPYDVNYIESPHLNLSTEDSVLISFWYRLDEDLLNLPIYTPIQFMSDCDNTLYNVAGLPKMRDRTWDFCNFYLPVQADMSADVQIRIYNGNGYTFNCCNNGKDIVIDDIYVGPAKPDLSIERDKTNRFTSSALSTDTLEYFLNNSGLAATPLTTTAFYWSTDSILDATDIFLGTKQEQALTDTLRVWTSFGFTKPTTSPGKYFIIYVLDSTDLVDEMREYNNIGHIVYHQENLESIPYFNDFEIQIDGWYHNSTVGKDDWQWTTPNGTLLDSAFSGIKTWITNDMGLVSSMSRMHLYTPVFDLSTTTNPVLEFDMKLDSDGSCNCFEGKMNLSYSVDGGVSWIILDTTNQSYNRWYYPTEFNRFTGVDEIYGTNYTELLFEPTENAFASFKQYNGRDTRRQTRYVLDLTYLGGPSHIRFRYNLGTENNFAPSPNPTVEGAMIDNFSIREAFTDLNVDYKKALMISSNAPEIKFYMHIRNQGNYITSPSIAKFYVSPDTLLSSSDFYLGQTDVPEIRPDIYFYTNKAFTAPANLGSYKYLIYELDATDSNSESNETNNIGYWELALDSINSYPYFQDFNDSLIHGWHQYGIGPYNTDIGNYRFRNMLAPSEPIGATDMQSGEWFTELVRYGNWLHSPFLYLETPTFDFSLNDSILLSFDMMCTGRILPPSERDGGNLHFSTDGGNTWTVLTTQFGQATNWYNYTSLDRLDHEPGWAEQPAGFGNAVLDSRTFDLTFLKGESDVTFRFKHKTNWYFYGTGATVVGMRVDNFNINGFTIDYVAQESMTPIFGNTSTPDIDVNYSISNTGNIDGKNTTTKFYWSTDSIFDSSDALLQTISESPISSGSTYNSTATITYPTPSTAPVYYIFYHTDSDSSMIEANELNNIGSFKVFLSPIADYYSTVIGDSIIATTLQPTFPVSYSIVNQGSLDGAPSTTKLYWSEDSIFDTGDSTILSINENPILIGDTLKSTINLSYPSPINQVVYYLYYQTDADSLITEANEFNNVGSYKIFFSPSVDYHSNINGDTILANSSQTTIPVTYTIVNTGFSDGTNSATEFYWSTDSLLDTNDQNVQSIVESPILAGDTLNTSIDIMYPLPLNQLVYYLFYEADINDTILEINEGDNTGKFVVVFDPLNSAYHLQDNQMEMYVHEGKVYIQRFTTAYDAPNSLILINVHGQILFQSKIVINLGLNAYSLPSNLARGIYVLSLTHPSGILTKKIIISE